MPDPGVLADAKRRIEESEQALIHLGHDRSNPDNNVLRIRFVQQLREALEDYYSILSGQSSEQAAKDFSN